MSRVDGRLVGWLAFVASFSALSYSANLFSSGREDTLGEPLYRYATAVGGLVQYAIVLGIVLAICVGASRHELLALRRPRSWPVAAGIALAVFVGVFALGALLDPILHAGEEQGLVPDRWEPEHAGAFAANFAVVVLVAPIVEELTFRGLGFSLLERFGRPLAIVLVGLTFGLAHGLVSALPLLAAFGSGLAFLRSRTNSVYPGMILHGIFNAVSLIAAVTT